MTSPDEEAEKEHAEDVQDLMDEVKRLEEDAKRLTRAYNIACYNVAELSEQKGMLGDALQTATLLLDEIMTEMRLANVTPSAKMIYSKANFDQAMKKLLRYEPPERADAYREDSSGEASS